MTARNVLTAAALALVCLLSLSGSHQPAGGQPPAANPGPVAPAVGRYQVSAYALPSGSAGAYVVDTQAGDVFQVTGRGEPVRVGSVARPQPPK